MTDDEINNDHWASPEERARRIRELRADRANGVEFKDLRRASYEDLYGAEFVANTTMEEIEHCAAAVCGLADEQGLVVITAEVVKLLIRERAAARRARLRYGDIVQPGARVRVHPEPEPEPEPVLPVGVVEEIRDGRNPYTGKPFK